MIHKLVVQLNDTFIILDTFTFLTYKLKYIHYINIYMLFLITVFSLLFLNVGNIISILLIEVYGRRKLLYWGMLFAALCSIGFASGVKHRIFILSFAALFNTFTVICWNSLDCLSVELFPTNIRTTAMGILAASGRLGAFIAQFVDGALEKNIPLLFVVTSSCMVIGGLASVLLPKDDMTGTSVIDDNNSNNHTSSLLISKGQDSLPETDDCRYNDHDSQLNRYFTLKSSIEGC